MDEGEFGIPRPTVFVRIVKSANTGMINCSLCVLAAIIESFGYEYTFVF